HASSCPASGQTDQGGNSPTVSSTEKKTTIFKGTVLQKAGAAAAGGSGSTPPGLGLVLAVGKLRGDQGANGPSRLARSIRRSWKSGRERSGSRSESRRIQSKDLYPAATARRSVSIALSNSTGPSPAGRPEPGAPATPPSRAWQPARWYRVSL